MLGVDEMKKEFWYEIALYACMLILGLALAMWAEKVTNIVSILLGVLALVYAAFGFISFFQDKERKVEDNAKLIYAIVMLVIGGILIFKVGFLKELVSFVIGIYIFITSLLKLSQTIKIKNKIGIILSGILGGLCALVMKETLGRNIPDIIPELKDKIESLENLNTKSFHSTEYPSFLI